MSLYAERIAPTLIDFACGRGLIAKLRAKVVPEAQGVVLEVGAGSGLNFGFYDKARVTRVIALEPSAGMRAKGRRREPHAPAPVDWLDAGAEATPLADHSVDTVVLTFTLCSIPDPSAALAEMRRVLKPGGALIVCEHGLAPDPGVARWQRRIEPVWRPLAAGCHLTRDTAALVAGAGFAFERVEADYMKGAPRFAGFVTSGLARAITPNKPISASID